LAAFDPVHPAYNPYFSACFFNRNSIFLSRQISQRYFSTASLSAQPNRGIIIPWAVVLRARPGRKQAVSCGVALARRTSTTQRHPPAALSSSSSSREQALIHEDMTHHRRHSPSPVPSCSPAWGRRPTDPLHRTETELPSAPRPVPTPGSARRWGCRCRAYEATSRGSRAPRRASPGLNGSTAPVLDGLGGAGPAWTVGAELDHPAAVVLLAGTRRA
jgi:hypothetical protein